MGGEKPTGTVVLTVLYVIEGLFGIAYGAMLASGGGMMGFAGMGLAGSLLAGIGAIVLIIGLIDFAVAYGLWNLRPWARTVAIIFAIIGLLGFPIGTIISIIILWYLFKPEIKEAFGVQ
ncbi:MAG: hypothetical protein FE045_05030 [Thermoplasmata archaeon]|nr:MAG: hypothetical protein FE045_05030 [Thermoplasmata archaeon]